MVWTADMFKPILDAAKEFVPIGVGVGVSYWAIVTVAKKGFGFIKGMIKG